MNLRNTVFPYINVIPDKQISNQVENSPFITSLTSIDIKKWTFK